MPLSAGQRLGPYEIVSSVGAGGMGEVYRARDTRLDRTVAVKVLPTHLSNNPQSRERFDREAKAISSLSHPHICPLYDVGHRDGIDFLVMEYLEGETLAHRLKKGPLPPDQVLQYAVQITDALDAAHRHGVIHRDLKPGNIMLTKTGAGSLAGFVWTVLALGHKALQPLRFDRLDQLGEARVELRRFADWLVEPGEHLRSQDVPALGRRLAHHILAREDHHVENVVDECRGPGAVVLERIE